MSRKTEQLFNRGDGVVIPAPLFKLMIYCLNAVRYKKTCGGYIWAYV